MSLLSRAKAFFLCFSLLVTLFSTGPLLCIEKTSDHIIPQTHPIKPLLDKVFPTADVLHDLTSLTQAGFIVINSRKRVAMRVIKHPLVPGYLFKVFLEGENRPSDREKQNKNFMYRCRAADTIRSLIASHGITNFIVPDKWLYLPASSQEVSKRRFVLVVTEMHIVNEQESRIAWKTKITPQHIREYLLIKEEAPLSQTLPANVPYTQEGKFAFIDTEKRSYKINKLRHLLSPEMQAYLDELLQSHRMQDAGVNSLQYTHTAF